MSYQFGDTVEVVKPSDGCRVGDRMVIMNWEPDDQGRWPVIPADNARVLRGEEAKRYAAEEGLASQWIHNVQCYLIWAMGTRIWKVYPDEIAPASLSSHA